jgi:beta-lactamase regulating signal transducer with metallopeptidase domain/thiol-disulfide isomerase/thioredoxin/uncharacterized GH25 family protein
MNSLQALSDSPLIERLGWILLHSIWQALAVAIGLAVVLPAVRKRGAQAGYAVCCGGLLLTILLPALTFPFVPNSARVRTDSENVAVLSVVLPNISAGMPIASRRTPAIETFSSDRPIPKIIDRSSASPSPSPSPIAVGSPHAAPAGEVSFVEPSFKERVASLGRQFQAQMSWSLPWIVLIWSLGVSAVSLWNVGGWFTVQRLKVRATCPVTGTIQDAAARIARQLGLVRTVRLLQSALVDTPVVIGAIKPVILLPASLVTELPPDQLESLLAHELAHVLRQDYLVNLLQSVIETLLFYHPAVWWISSQVRADRENCCDDMAVRLAADRTIYVQALAAAAGARAPKIVPAATGGLLLPRLRRILGIADPHSAHPSRWLTGAVMLSLCGTALTLLAVESRSATAQTKTEQTSASKAQETKKPSKPGAPAAKPRRTHKEPEFPTKGRMRIEVVDTAGKPLAQAEIHASIWTEEENFKANRDYTTDSQGFATIQLPKALQILRLWASKSGYCGEFVNFQTNTAVHTLVIPDDYQFRLVKGTLIGGVVKNEDGQPIKGAKVAYCHDEIFFNDDTVTDANGRWKFDDVRPSKEVFIRVTHPDYISDHFGEMQKEQQVTTAMLRTQTATIVMRRGLRITGKVTDPTGKPVKRAILLSGDDPYFGQVTSPIRTNEQGQFQFPAMAAGPIRLTVVAKGWMPETRQIQIAAGMRSTDFQLKPGKKLRIRFVSRAGTPIPEVRVSIEQWKSVRHLMTEPNWHLQLEIPERANKEGVFEWDWAPGDAVKYNFSKNGYAQIRGATVTADDREHAQVLNSILEISGSVRDAVNGRPIDGFLAVPVIHFRPDFAALERNQARHEKAGRFSLAFDRTDVEHGVQIEAPGYRTFRTSHRWRSGDADAVLDVRLERSPRYIGSVVDGEGRAVKDARVYLASASEQFSLNRIKEPDAAEYDTNSRVNLDVNGRFEIASQLEPYALIVISREGYGEILRAASETPGQIRIHRWAKVTGRLIQSGKPVPNCNVMLSTIRIVGGDEPHVFINLQTTTLDDGSFAFDRAPPVPCRVSGWLHFSAGSPLTSSHSVPLRLAPGQKAHVTLGGTGIDVTGQLVAENQPPGFDYHFAINYLVAKRPGIQPPPFLVGKGFDWQKGWSDSWTNSPEGTAYLNTMHNWFVKPEPDGRFRISGVEPGEYDFAVNLYGTTEGCLVHPIATRVVHISVNPGQQQLDLGKISIPSLTLPKVGDLAADFEFTTPGGTQTSLSAWRGKYVLLDFWATWCGPCVAKLDEVERLRKQFEADDRLVVVGVNLDSDADSARKFLKTRPLPWQHALLGDWSSTDVPRRFAISNVPAYVLIDPNGRILASEYSLAEIASKLNRLSKEQPERDKHRS